MCKKINSTDLHIKYKMNTGQWYQWEGKNTNTFHSLESYSREYCKWIEEEHLQLLNETNNYKELLEYVESELEEATETISDLNNKIECLREIAAGADL